MLLLVGTGPREYREALLRSLAGQRLWLLTDRAPSWQLPYLAGHTVVPALNAARVSTKLDFLTSVVDGLAEEHGVRGVLTFEEMFLSAASRLADRLGLPSLGEGVAENCRDKRRTRQLLTAAGVRQPGYGSAATPEEAAGLAERFGYPVVVKPRGLAGSIGVVLVRSAEELTQAFRTAASASRTGARHHGDVVLVEEFLDGPEVSVDSAVVDGRLEPLYVVLKRFGPAPYFEETGQTVHADDPLLDDEELIGTVREAVAALGLRNAMTHTEIKLTSRGPVIVEVNGRLAGDFIPHIAKLATGLDGAAIAAALACGEPPDLRRTEHRSAAHQLLYADRDGTVDSVTLPAPGSLPRLVDSGPLLAPGTRVAVPPRGYMARCGYVIVAAPDRGSCDAALAEAVGAMSARITPAGAGAAGITAAARGGA
ncbi:ATP-grasp domain-containing protein [Kitasatospora sp. NPDC051853]|uniref:ATP-grasp domain-containing protein n=1 Tax=Kitasatospora sp. NPDC051853 TaxID=3364058 RepID=UPI0037A08E3A